MTGSASDTDDAVRGLESRCEELEAREMALLKEYHDLVGVTGELVELLQETFQGRRLTGETLTRVVSRLHSLTVRATSTSTSTSANGGVSGVASSAVPPSVYSSLNLAIARTSTPYGVSRTATSHDDRLATTTTLSSAAAATITTSTKSGGSQHVHDTGTAMGNGRGFQSAHSTPQRTPLPTVPFLSGGVATSSAMYASAATTTHSTAASTAPTYGSTTVTTSYATDDHEPSNTGRESSASVTRRPILPSPTFMTLGAPIDYARVHHDIREWVADREERSSQESATQLVLLLQALRWRLSKTTPGPERRAAVEALLDGDVLGCGANTQTRCVLHGVLSHPGEMVREYGARLVNTIASLCVGRSYLLHRDHGRDTAIRSLVDLLQESIGVSALEGDGFDTICHQNALGALQKLSLRRHAQSIMIELGVVEWLVRLLREYMDALSDYSCEYATALLMNLCLRARGKQRCVTERDCFLRIMSDLLEHENLQIRSYVNGSLYAVVGVPVVREAARASGLDTQLRLLMAKSDETLASQIEYILREIESDADAASEGDEVDEDDAEDDDDDDVDEGIEAGEEGDLLADDDDVETVAVSVGTKQGDVLLADYEASAHYNQTQKGNYNSNGNAYARMSLSPSTHAHGTSRLAGSVRESVATITSSTSPLKRPVTPASTTIAAPRDRAATLAGPAHASCTSRPTSTTSSRTPVPAPNEYQSVFSTRARIPRTAEEGARPVPLEQQFAMMSAVSTSMSQSTTGKPTSTSSDLNSRRARETRAASSTSAARAPAPMSPSTSSSRSIVPQSTLTSSPPPLHLRDLVATTELRESRPSSARSSTSSTHIKGGTSRTSTATFTAATTSTSTAARLTMRRDTHLVSPGSSAQWSARAKSAEPPRPKSPQLVRKGTKTLRSADGQRRRRGGES